MKIILTDDSNTMRKIQRRVLTEMGIVDVLEAGNGAEALKLLKEQNYQIDLMLCDINMPEMDGIETLDRIRQIPEAANIPVIMCTSVADKDQVIRAIKAGAKGYVVKPFRPEDLQKKIEAVVGPRPKPDAAVSPPPVPPAAP
ncbi:MAG: hypothetical protein A3K19_19460 [Lentisphaerae bacterium RIFOXYB12_FULL_65_16]|nr:MAG: hypothetical protein A3K18_31355 [Lentisphaerae bacterium RIFOXYA12_64_32]OGV92040.1 MAG: hypothetical protein A3K19_19460 [Lentisphaerae bacterium RIFOXYB12_FULL_65_16]